MGKFINDNPFYGGELCPAENKLLAFQHKTPKYIVQTEV